MLKKIISIWCIQLICWQVFAKADQFIIHFAEDPRDALEHKEWTVVIEEALDEVNQRLVNDGYISLPLLQQEKQKKAVPHFIRKDHDFGHFTVRVPQGVPSDIFIRYLNEIFKEKKFSFHITPDAPVRLATPVRSPVEFDLESLKQLKTGATIVEQEQELASIPMSKKSLRQQKANNVAFLKKEQSLLYWYQEFPTTGLRLGKKTTCYPFLPHMFSLWDLAPHKGAGVKIGILDTGIAAFTFQDDPTYRKNKDLYMQANFAEYNYNVVSDNGLDPLHELIDCVRLYLPKDTVDHKELAHLLPSWIRDFLLNRDTRQIVVYLQQKGKKGLVDADGNVTILGKKALEEITTGDQGIAPKGENPRFTLKNLINPWQKNSIFEFVPVESKTLGHGI